LRRPASRENQRVEARSRSMAPSVLRSDAPVTRIRRPLRFELDAHYYVETSAARVVATLPLVAGTITPVLFALASRPRESLSASHS
jgi:hypothetical protein